MAPSPPPPPMPPWSQRLLDLAGAHPVSPGRAVPVHAKTDRIPHLPQAPQHAWVLAHALAPLALHQAWLALSGRDRLSAPAAFALYAVAFAAAVVREVHALRTLAHRHGFLDGDAAPRDAVPPAEAARVAVAVAVAVAYRADEPPAAALARPRWWLWLALAVGLYGVVLDFWFYLYHRALHDVPPLWRLHRAHHRAKHPVPLLTAFGDGVQEAGDMLGVPLLTWLTFRAAGAPLGFYDWWICHQYVVYTEVWGHSGIRVHVSPPSTLSWLLALVDADLAVEDHDLHHRLGYRKSHNYGKQTGLWDRLFGTCRDRIESAPANIDYDNPATMPFA